MVFGQSLPDLRSEFFGTNWLLHWLDARPWGRLGNRDFKDSPARMSLLCKLAAVPPGVGLKIVPRWEPDELGLRRAVQEVVSALIPRATSTPSYASFFKRESIAS